MRVLICAIGSRGDVQPMLVLGAALARRGHAVCIAAPPNFGELVRSHALEFVSCGVDTERVISDNRELAELPPWRAIPGQIALLRRETERQIRDLLGFGGALDLVVCAGLAFGGRSLAEQRSARYAFVCYTLAGIRDPAHPPAALPVFGLPKAGNAALWWTITRCFDWALRAPFDRARIAHGLGREPAPWRRVHAEHTLLAQDALIGSVPAAATRFTHQVPALVSTILESDELPAEVERFLGPRGSNGAPAPARVYVGFGSMPSVDRDRVVRAVVEFQRVTGARVLLYSGRQDDQRSGLPSGVLGIGASDHARLFPRLDWIVHHGGAGTLATALRSGVPQLVVPHIVDQFFHGRRVHELGLGPAPIPKAKLDATGLIRAFHESRASVARARGVGNQLAGTSGADLAAEHLERAPRV